VSVSRYKKRDPVPRRFFSDIKKGVKNERAFDPLRQQLRHGLDDARRETDRLFEMIAPAAIYERPIPERHRVIFYLGHLEAFDWNMICATSFGMDSLNSQFDRLFAFGIDPVDGKLPHDQPSDWPRVEEIVSYNRSIRKTIDELLDRANFQNPAEPYVRNGQIFHVAIEHRLMHAETLAYMLHWLDYGQKRSAGRPAVGALYKRPGGHRPPLQQRIPAGHAQLGQQPGLFGWDNEFQSCSIFVPEFSMDVLNVTNGDFLEFIHEGGYDHRPFWTDDSWNWIRHDGVRHPKFWAHRGETWFYRTMFEEIPLRRDWPVYVSHAEAAAYARWKGRSLPTESQYHRAAFGSPDRASQPTRLSGNFDFKSWTPLPVGTSPNSKSAFGIYDLMGNGWEWTNTPFAPFNGFEPFPFYAGYSADFFDGKHFVMKGASPRTAAALARKSFRNWFQPHYPNIYATFRCVQ
jgi:iron(II)-dependent oxidoreductase